MISCLLQGGLGNQLFQVSTTCALAWENNDEAVFDLSAHHLPLQGNKVENYRDNVFRNINFQNLDLTHFQTIKESEDFRYQKDSILFGYFQSEKYFINYRNRLLNLYSPNESIENYIKNKYDYILHENTVSLHIRRGDYLKLQHVHPICDMDYYIKAINMFSKDSVFLVFSDDTPWCKQVFKSKKYIIIEEEKDYIDLYLMSMCKNNIIANSSFSWWGAWLNNNENKIVVAPKKWINNKEYEQIYTNKQIIL